MKILRAYKKHIRIFIFLLALLPAFLSIAQENGEKPVHVLTMQGPISPALYNYMQKGFTRAQAENAQLILIELNTPGGLLTTTREMTTLILNSPIPVAVHVTPSGSHAASAGTFLVYASHVAAMSDGTNIGAATPIQMGGAPSSPSKKGEQETKEEKSNADALDQKALQDTSAFIRSLAKMRDRNAEWAVKAVQEADSLTASEAKDDNVVEYIANSRADLLKQIDGKTITVTDGKTTTLSLKGAPLVENIPDLKTKLLTFITDPNVAMILMSIGVYGLILEFYHPGTMVAGTIGIISLLLGFYAMNVLPINLTGLLLIVLAAGLFVAEAFIPSFGILGIGGIAAFVIGASMVFEGESMPGLALDMGIVWGIAATGALIMGLFGYVIAKSLKKQAGTGAEGMIGESAEVIEWSGTEGLVHIQGEIWKAWSEHALSLTPGGKVMVSATQDLRLKIRPLNS